MPDRPTCLMVGYYGADNLGDEILLNTIGRWVQEFGYHVCALSFNPALSARIHPNFSFKNYENLEELFDIVREASVVIMGGGGPLHEYNRLRSDDILNFPGIEGSIYLQPLILAQQCGLPIGLLAQGVGPLFSDEAKKLVHRIFVDADFVTVRSIHDWRTLRDIGVDRRISVYPDPAWLSMPHRNYHRSDHPLLVIEVRDWPFEENWAWRLAAAILEIFISRGWIIRYCCFGGKSDLEQIYRVAAYYGDPSPEIIPATLNEVDLPFRGAHRAVTMRFHAAIAAVSAGVPTCLLAYDGKIRALHDQIHIEQNQYLAINSSKDDYLTIFARLLNTDYIENNISIKSRHTAIGHRNELGSALSKFGDRKIIKQPESTAQGRAWLDHKISSNNDLTGILDHDD